MTHAATRRWIWVPLLLCAASAFAQPSAKRTKHAYLEIPLELKRKIVAGQAAVGTPVEGKLVIATLVHGVVIPEGAIFTGKVEESVARQGSNPSRLKIHITASKWREGSRSVDLYLTNLYYPRHRSHEGGDADAETSGRVLPQVLNSIQQSGAIPAQVGSPEVPNERNRYDRRIVVDGVKLERSENGAIAITAEKFNVRFDNGSVYCFEGTAAK